MNSVLKKVPGLGLPWKLAAEIKNRLYDREALNIFRASVPLISVGNLTMGGTGKTPLMIDLVQFFEQHLRVGVVNRSYGGALKEPLCLNSKNKLYPSLGVAITSALVGDEALLLQQKCKNASVFTGPSKSKTAEYIVKNDQCDLIIVDDGYQHRQLHRDCNILLLDATEPMENYQCFPQGRGREAFSALSRADLIFVTKVNLAPTIQVQRLLEAINRELQSLAEHRRAPVFQLEYLNDRLEHVVLTSEGNQSRISSRQVLAIGELAKASLIAVSAIGRPSGFEHSIKQLGLKFSEHLKFPDHHRYTISDAAVLQMKMKKNLIVTTEKDLVKLTELVWPQGTTFLILCQRIQVSPHERDPYAVIKQKTGLTFGT